MGQESWKRHTIKAANLLVAIILGLSSLLGAPRQVSASASQPAEINPLTLCSTQVEIPQSECDVLAAIYNSMVGYNWTTHTNWMITVMPCNWYGITCSGGHVTEIDLQSNNLTGSIPTSIGALPYLTSLDLQYNGLTGTLPTALGSLSNLVVLDVGENSLTGAIPYQLGNLHNLTTLALEENSLSGNIPPQLGNLSNLLALQLWSNQLTGTIPVELAQLSNLYYFHLGGNYLSGSIPAQLGQMSSLVSLQFQYNDLTGSIPPQLTNLANLDSLFLGWNSLEGGIPPELGSMPNLTRLSLEGNQLTGNVPDQLGNLTNLTWLTFYNNALSGRLPLTLTNLTKLTKFYYENNDVCEPLKADFQTWVAGIGTDRTTPAIKCPPVIIVPGIAGSVLMNGSKELWPHTADLPGSYTCLGADDDLLQLSLQADGITDAHPTVTATDVVRTEATKCGLLSSDTIDGYDTTIKTFTAKGYDEGKLDGTVVPGASLFVYPYDWRKGIDPAAANLLTTIDQVLAQTGASQVDIFAHSMGGLVARAVLSNPNSDGKIRKLVTVGTPVLGAPKALGMLEYGSPCFVDPSFGVYCGLNRQTLQAAVRNFPGVYTLLPSRMYDSSGERAPLNIWWDRDQDTKTDGPQTYEGWSTIVKNDPDRNRNLVVNAEAFHAVSDNLSPYDPNVKYVAVIGDGVPTVDQIVETRWVDPSGKNVSIYDDPLWGSLGDGTVPLYSARLYNSAAHFDIRNGAIVPEAYHHVKHADLAKDVNVLNDVIAFFKTNGSPYPRAVAATEVVSESTTTGTEIGIYGSSGGYIQDGSGNTSGQDASGGFVSLNIPGSNYFALGDTQSYFFENAGSYQAVLNGTGSGATTVEMSNYQGGNVQEQALFDVDVTASTRMNLAFSSGQSASTLQLQVDAAGDGVYETTLLPTKVLYTISGKVSTSEVVLTYQNGGTQTVRSDALGNYSFSVPSGWSGTVTPSKTGYAFLPKNRSYTNVTAPLAGQDFTPRAVFASSGAYDGWVLEISETSGKGGSLSKTATTLRIGDDVANKQYRSILSFNTGGLPDDALITGVTLKIRRQAIVGGLNPFPLLMGMYVDVMKGAFGLGTLEIKDFQATAVSSKLKAFGPFKPSANASGWYSLNLPSAAYAYINKTSTSAGLTQVRLRFKLDDNNNFLDNYLSFFSGNAPATSRPQLIIQYTIP